MTSEEAKREKQRRAERQETGGWPPPTPEEIALIPPETEKAADLLGQLATQLEAGGRYDVFAAFGVRGLERAVRRCGEGIAAGRAARKRFGESDPT